jgi:tRNA pseudouridine38-40 synthase
MANIALVIEYDGSQFFGFQKQKTNFRTIQHELEQALSKFANQPINIVTAGRTDTGVHALFQVINFQTDVKRKLYGWVNGVNALLPADIVVREAVVVPDNFDARFSAISRSYKYYLLQDRVPSAILRGKLGLHYQNLDIDTMRVAGESLIGKQDFSAFRASNCQANTPIRELTKFSIEQQNNLLCFNFTANAFLYHMIRNIVGALVYVGMNKLSVNSFNELLLSKDRTKAPPTFMPDGLYLSHVGYAEEYFSYKPITYFF